MANTAAAAAATTAADAVPTASSYMIHLRIAEAKNVLAADSNGKSDPFVKIAVGGDHLSKPKTKAKYTEKTFICPETLHPVWNQDFTFVLDSLSGNVRLKCYDHDKVGKNDFLGQVVFRLQLLKQKGTISGWHPLVDKKNALSQGSLYFHATVDAKDRSLAWKNPKKPSDTEQKELNTARQALFAKLDAGELKVNGIDSTTASGTKVIKSKELSIFCGTWNVGNASPSDDLTAWLNPSGSDRHDIYAIGVQECVYKPRKAGQTRTQDDWDGVLQHYFERLSASGRTSTTTTTAAPAAATTAGSGGAKDSKSAPAAPQYPTDYVQVKVTSLLEIRLNVWARRDICHRISMVQTHTEATGLGHVVGNKGGAVINLHVDDLSLCFVTSHLAAHQGKCERRNADFSEIVKGVRLGQFHVDMLHQFHHVFWMGDLNYRIDFEAQGDDKEPSKQLFDEICKKISDQKFTELFAKDQLVREREAKRAFVGFSEGKYNFPPTFKCLKGKVNEYNHERSPAYCDRILWRSFPGQAITQTSFGSAPAIITSDHKPVYGTFKVAPFLYPNGTDSNRGAFSLTITGLSGRGLPIADVTTKSADPYVKFAAPFLKKVYQTECLKQTLNPDWKAVPVFESNVNSIARLGASFICIQVTDRDKVGKDDPMCDAVLFLSDVLSGTALGTKPYHFKLVTSAGGIPSGTLEGDITIQWANK